MTDPFKKPEELLAKGIEAAYLAGVKDEREACAKVAEADLLGTPEGLAPAEHRFDNGSSERAARRIAAAIRARKP